VIGGVHLGLEQWLFEIPSMGIEAGPGNGKLASNSAGGRRSSEWLIAEAKTGDPAYNGV
jgi:hypothetical protein